MNKLPIYLLLSTLSVGCSSKYAQTKDFKPIIESHVDVIQNYEVGREKTANVGDKIIERGIGKYDSINSGHFIGLVTTGDKTYSVKKGVLYRSIYVDEQDGSFYVKDDDNEYEFPSGTKINKDGALTDSTWYYYNIGGLQRGFEVNRVGNIGDKMFEPVAPVKKYSGDSHKSELVYSGKSGHAIKFLYREYVGDVEKPYSSQDLTYDLSESNVVRVKNFRIKIQSATNENIEYVILSDK
jgi:hypothetical protein